MSQLVAGISLIVLAALVVFGIMVEVSSGDLKTLDPPSLTTNPSPSRSDPDVMVRLGSGPKLEGDPAIMGYEEGIELDNLGVLTRREKEKVDRDRFLHYSIKRGETLSGLSRRYLGNASLWRKILQHNPHVKDERDIQEGTVIRIPLFERGS